MALTNNQTIATIEINDIIANPNNLSWYPFFPGRCPPPYYIILQGVCAPLIIIISTVLNSLIAVVLLQKHLRSPTNILLLAIALYDTLTGLFPFPAYIFVFTFQQCHDYMPYNYGWFHRINHDVLPFIFHTCSIWVRLIELFNQCALFVFVFLDYRSIGYSTLYLCLSFRESETMVYSTHGIEIDCLCEYACIDYSHTDVCRREIIYISRSFARRSEENIRCLYCP